MNSGDHGIGPERIEPPGYGKPGMSEEVAKADLCMASDDSAYMVGENLILCGGMASI
ncbi:MAG: hypothetical protein R3175_13630 [Marinobacter sp.]|uniref:hypothetical protein n=1 Tax=Marinobacter sp. TaxID=50741 RepID=UPI00299ECE88|nr:hypothetical protein [Marinobacter sp.]MDX1757097.1 hypothetical protein [Marinobacter sp.]